MEQLRPLALVLLLMLALAACGGSGGSGDADEPEAAAQVETVETTSTTEEVTLPGWMSPFLAQDGPEVAVIFSTGDYAPGKNRVGFLVVENDGQLVQAPVARIFVGREDAVEPIAVEASLQPLGPHSHPAETEAHDHIDFTDLYVATVELPEPGRYWMVVQPEGEAIQAIGALDVRTETQSPALGTKAISSDNPTIDDAPAREITTARPPDTELLRHSIADSLEAGVPFVAVFATPEFCQTRACGPTVEIVDAVRQQFADSDLRFIHVEIYEGNDPANGPNRWFQEWGLGTEPWVFLVDREGVIRAKFEGSVSVAELEDAVRANLL